MRFDPTPRRRRHPLSVAFLGFFAVVVVGVLLLSFLPLHDKLQLHTKGQLHYPGHMLAFGGVAMLLVYAARTHGMRILATVAALGFGFLVEFLQHVAYKEAMEWTDVTVDCIAVLAAALLVYLFVPKPRA